MTTATLDGLDLYPLLKEIGMRVLYTEVDDHNSLG
jgi:hypothetical protein